MILFQISCQTVRAPGEADPDPSTSPAVQPGGFFHPEDCWFEIPDEKSIDCGFVEVPEDHNQPNGRSVYLAVVVLRDRSDDHQPDPVIMLAGGPGERVAADALELSQLITPIHPNRDLVIYDQRGVGLSKPALECPEFVDAMLDNLDAPDNGQAAKRQFEALMTCRDRYLSAEINLSAFNTRQSAADVEALRDALGYDQINLYGASYGSLLAQAVMRDFPEHVRSVSMNSILPIEKSIFLDTPTTASQAIMDLIHACHQDQSCSTAYPNLKEELFSVVEELNKDPIPMTLTDPQSGEQFDAKLTGDAVVGNLFTFLYMTRIIPILPQAIHHVYEGDYSLMRQLSSTRLILLDALSRGTMLSVLCRDDLIGRTEHEQLAIRAALPDPLVSDIADHDLIEYGAFGLCKNWPVEEDAPTVKQPLTSDIPTLLLAGEFDPITPPQYAKIVVEGLDRGHLIELPGVGHDVLSSPCAQSVTSQFIENPLEFEPAVCLSEMQGITFDLPSVPGELVLKPFVDETRGFQGVIPDGWQELAPANLARSQTALDPAYFVLEGKPGSKSVLFDDLTSQLGLDPAQAPESEKDIGNFNWAFYRYDRGEALIDLALAEMDGKAYFVLLISPQDEVDQLYNNLFLPAVVAMASLE